MNMWGVFVFACFFKISFAFSSFTIIDKYLNGTQLRTVQVESWYECIKVCQEEPRCISYNFDNKSECQINGHGVEERCQAHHELTSRAGWIYHQIREVNKKIGRSKTQGLCPCNCGASKQCRVEPDYGDVPEKALRSCSEILKRRRRRHTPDGAYYLYKEKQPIFCHMTSIPGCKNEDGWTLVMKINGSKKTFKYDSDYWKYPYEYQPENGANLEEKETKLATFGYYSFTNICLGMKSFNSSSINWLMKKRSSGGYLIQIFGDKQNVPFALEKAEWSKLLPGSTLDDGKKEDGFNVKPPSGDGARVRIGAIAHPTSGGDPISYIGFGAGGDAAAMHLGLTCGNVNGKRYIPAFCYILVK